MGQTERVPNSQLCLPVRGSFIRICILNDKHSEISNFTSGKRFLRSLVNNLIQNSCKLDTRLQFLFDLFACSLTVPQRLLSDVSGQPSSFVGGYISDDFCCLG